MSDKVIFIDANVYLRFYDTSSRKFKSLLKSIVEIREKIFITDQIRDEVNRNKLQAAINSFSPNFKEPGIKKITLPEHFDEYFDKKISKWNKERAKIIDQEKNFKKEHSKIVSDLLMSIMKSTDNVSVELEKIFNLSRSPSKTEILSARNRKELGNPPGKANDPLGDQLSWEQFLTVYDDKEIWIITNDRDFISEYENRFYLNPFLYNELKKNKNTPKINLFRSLPEGIEDYNTKSDHQMISIPSGEEMREIKIEETEILSRNIIVSSNIVSIGYDHKNLTLEVEFISGAVYQYSGVPEEVYQGLMNAGSHGKYFDQYIKKAGYPYVKIG